MSTELAVRQDPIPMTLTEVMELGAVLAKSGFFADSRDASQAVVKVLAGRELGFPPIASMKGIYIVKGQVSLSANLMAAAIRRSDKYDYRITELTHEKCVVEFYENGQKLHPPSEFTTKDAQIAGLTGDNWKKFARNMLFARALSNGARWHCPDVFSGPIYTPEELGADVDAETGDVVTVTTVSTTTAADASTANGAEKTSGVSDTFADHEAAVQWGLEQLVFNHENHAQNSYKNLAAESGYNDKPRKVNKNQLYEMWRTKVNGYVVERETLIAALKEKLPNPEELAAYIEVSSEGKKRDVDTLLTGELEKALKGLQQSVGAQPAMAEEDLPF